MLDPRCDQSMTREPQMSRLGFEINCKIKIRDTSITVYLNNTTFIRSIMKSDGTISVSI